MPENLRQALNFLEKVTGGSFNLWVLMGNKNVKLRQQLMTILIGGPKKVPQAQCGVNKLWKKFYEFVPPKGGCEAAKQSYFIAWCKSIGQGMTEEMYLDWVNNFLSVAAFADHYSLEEEKAREMIDNYRSLLAD